MAIFGRPTEQQEQRATDYAHWIAQREPMAIASLVLGVISLIEFGVLFVFGIAGIVLGFIALRRLRTGSARPRGHYLAWTGIATSLASILIAVVFIYQWV